MIGLEGGLERSDPQPYWLLIGLSWLVLPDLDPVQVECKHRGEHFVEQGLHLYEWLALMLILLAGVVVCGDAVQRRSSSTTEDPTRSEAFVG